MGKGSLQGGHTTTCQGRLILAASIAALLAAGAPAAPARAQAAPGPSVTFQSGPEEPTPTNDPTPTFRFSASDPMASFECALDGAAPEPCESPYTTASLDDGAHSLAVRASDVLAGPGEWATRAFSIDTSVPAVTFTGGPDGRTLERRPSFSFSSQPGSAFECLLDGAAAGCGAGSLAPAGDLADGNHLVVVRATNPAGTTGPWAQRGFTVDTTGPQTVLVNPPPSHTSSSTPLIAFHSDESSARFECSIDGSPFSPCESPWAPGPLAAGPHHVAVRAVDALGNADATPATANFTVTDSGSTPGQRPDFETGVRMLAERLVLNLNMAVGTLRETELPTVLRQGRVSVRGIEWLVPGTLTLTGRAASARGRPVVLRGRVRLDAAGSGTLALRPTKAGRDLMRRKGSLPLIVGARFSTPGLTLSAAEKATLVRDWITPGEARRAVSRTLRRSYGAGARKPVVEIGARCGSGCLEVGAEWANGADLWTARGRARQVSGRLSAVLAEAVRRAR